MIKVLVTGAGGFVGEHFLNILKDKYFIIGTLYQQSKPSTKNCQFEELDVTDAHAFENLIKKYSPEVIVHLAGFAITWSKNPFEIFNPNLNGTINLYQAVIKNQEKKDYDPKIVYVSSSDVYGKVPHPDSIDESAPLLPFSLYGSSKVSADRVSYQYSQSNNLKIVILRPFTHTGPGQREGFFVPDMASQIVKIEQTRVENSISVGNLEAIRDYSDVRDIVEGYKLVIENDIEKGEVYNICSGKPIRIKTILDSLLKMSSKKITTVTDKARFRPVDIPIYIGSNKKFKNKYHWTPKIEIEKTLEDTLDFWRAQVGKTIKT